MTVQLPPWATAGMTVDAQVAQPRPAMVITAVVGTNMPRGVDGTRTPVRRWHGIGSPERRYVRMMRVVCTRGARRTLREARKRFGFARALAFGPGGQRRSWQLR